MNKICVEYIMPGMILAQDVKGLDENILLPAGTIIRDKEKNLLIDAGIEYVEVKARDKQEEENYIEMVAQEYAFKFFMYVNPDSDLFGELYKIVVEMLVEALKKGGILPCEEKLRAKNVERMKDIFLKDMGGPEDVIKNEVSLASFPDVYFKLKKVLDSKTASAKDIAQVVSADVALSAKLLKLVNSPLFGLTQKIDSIERAVSIIGEEELSNLALGITAIRYFKDIPPELIDMNTFWKHSLSCAVFAKIISSLLKLPKQELMFTCGLLHDVGKLILFKNLPYASVETLIFARENMIPVVEAEENVLGFTHTDISNLIMKEWEFPSSLIDIVGHHHEPEGAEHSVEATILQVADNMANAIAIANGGMFVVPGMEEESWNSLKLKVEILPQVVAKHNKVLKGLLSSIL